jgi:hypothetical protein
LRVFCSPVLSSSPLVISSSRCGTLNSAVDISYSHRAFNVILSDY